jgi:hypothetical protein
MNPLMMPLTHMKGVRVGLWKQRKNMTKEELRETKELVEWELTSMNYSALQEFFVNTKTEFYLNYRPALEDMLEYKKQYENTEIVLET